MIIYMVETRGVGAAIFLKDQMSIKHWTKCVCETNVIYDGWSFQYVIHSLQINFYNSLSNGLFNILGSNSKYVANKKSDSGVLIAIVETFFFWRMQ